LIRVYCQQLSKSYKDNAYTTNFQIFGRDFSRKEAGNHIFQKMWPPASYKYVKIMLFLDKALNDGASSSLRLENVGAGRESSNVESDIVAVNSSVDDLSTSD
jgi:hypothetical protein